jgi:Flp pilus assembly protein TadG
MRSLRLSRRVTIVVMGAMAGLLNIWTAFAMQLSRCLRDSSAAIGVATAMAMPILLGMGSLSIEVGHWYLEERVMQGAADAAAFSAAVQYIADQNSGNTSSTAYQTVGASYASLNGFTIPTANVCVIPVSGGDNCGTVRSLDARTIVCTRLPCIVVEITQNTFNWLSTRSSLGPTNSVGQVQRLPTPTLAARSIISMKYKSQTITDNGADCVLALANDPQAVLVHGNGDIQANCGLSIDGGLDQNVNGTPVGGISFSGSNAKINVASLVVATGSPACPDGGVHCQQFGSSTALPATAVLKNTATADPYTGLTFPTPPSGVQTGGVSLTVAGGGYTNGTRTFTVVGGTGTPAKFTATVAGGRVTAIGSVIDPGAYTTFPTGPVLVTPDTGGGSGAQFTLTEGCFTWNGTAIAGRKYCSINLNGAGTINFPAGNYYIAGGDSACVGFCVSSNNATVTSDAAGVTFYLTNGEGTGTYGTSSYARVAIASGNISLCAPGTVTAGTTCTATNYGTGCTAANGSCMLFVQNPNATAATSNPNGSQTATDNTFSGNGTRTLSGLVYLPEQAFSEGGNGPILGCFGVVAKYVDVGGTPTFSDGCLPGHGIGGTSVTVTVLSNPYLYQ